MLAANPKKILLAEDDRDDQKLFCDFLQHRTDIELLPVADNGIVLFDLLASMDTAGLPDLIILDHNMPRRNGLQTLQLLKDTERYAHIPVVIYSTYTDKQLIDACAEKGAFSVLPKPITKNGYGEMIDTVLVELTNM